MSSKRVGVLRTAYKVATQVFRTLILGSLHSHRLYSQERLPIGHASIENLCETKFHNPLSKIPTVRG